MRPRSLHVRRRVVLNVEVSQQPKASGILDYFPDTLCSAVEIWTLQVCASSAWQLISNETTSTSSPHVNHNHQRSSLRCIQRKIPEKKNKTTWCIDVLTNICSNKDKVVQRSTTVVVQSIKIVSDKRLSLSSFGTDSGSNLCCFTFLLNNISEICIVPLL